MNSDVYFGAYTSAFFVCSFRQFPSEEEAPGVSKVFLYRRHWRGDSLTPPLSPLPQRFPSLAPPPLSSFPPQSVGGRALCVTWPACPRPQRRAGAGQEVGPGGSLADGKELRLEEETEGGGRLERDAGGENAS